jgi:ribosomal protein S18 acetylase RimI-like enzyme
MSNFTSRIYADANDLEHLIDFVTSVRPPERISDYPSIIDLRELLCLPAMQANTRLWFAEVGHPCAFALVDSYNNLLFETVGPDFQELVNWGTACVKRQPHAADEPLTLDANCRAEDTERVALLERHGFVPLPTRSLRLTRSLRDPIPPPVLPDGFTIRPLQKHELAEWVALHRAAFGTEHMTVEERLAMMSGAGYDPQMDLVVEADNRLVAYCMGHISREENAQTGRNEGYTDPVATHPQYQGRGLAQALLLTGLRLLGARGVETAVMGTSSENVGMQKAAQAVGFRVESTKVWFAKPI